MHHKKNLDAESLTFPFSPGGDRDRKRGEAAILEKKVESIQALGTLGPSC